MKLRCVKIEEVIYDEETTKKGCLVRINTFQSQNIEDFPFYILTIVDDSNKYCIGCIYEFLK